MKYFLDTNICIYALKNKYPKIKERMEAVSPSDIAIPSLVKAELYYGAMKSQIKNKVISALDLFLAPFEIIPFADNEIMAYARIRADLEKKGNIIGPNDLIIAATAMSYGVILVTHNKKEFHKVENLSIEDWTE
jgi:tRNA(fMet)-specific endonuclease VapC